MTQPVATGARRVLLTGGSGLVGQAIAAELQKLRVQPVLASRATAGPLQSRGAGAASETLPWFPAQADAFPEPDRIEELTAVIHLSGANLAARRWSPDYKREIVTSRTQTTAALARTLARLSTPPGVLISASATGFYGDRGDEVLTEQSAPGKDFLAETCEAWEAATRPAVEAGIRVVHLRLGVVLTPKGGALAKVLPLFRAGLGGRLGSGMQWMSWIALDDVVQAVVSLAGLGERAGQDQTGSLAGPVNCVAPAPVTNAEYTRSLARVLHRPAFTAAPAFALRLAVGEMADAALLASCRAVPEKLLGSGFAFRYPAIEPALAHLLAG